MTPDELDVLLQKVAKGVPAVRSELAPDQKDINEVVNLELERRHARLHNDWLLIDLRKKYGRNIIKFLWTYFSFSVIVLILDGFSIGGFQLPDVVLAAIVGATAVSVLGVVGTVAAGLFKPPG